MKILKTTDCNHPVQKTEVLIVVQSCSLFDKSSQIQVENKVQ